MLCCYVCSTCNSAHFFDRYSITMFGMFFQPRVVPRGGAQPTRREQYRNKNSRQDEPKERCDRAGAVLLRSSPLAAAARG